MASYGSNEAFWPLVIVTVHWRLLSGECWLKIYLSISPISVIRLAKKSQEEDEEIKISYYDYYKQQDENAKS